MHASLRMIKLIKTQNQILTYSPHPSCKSPTVVPHFLFDFPISLSISALANQLARPPGILPLLPMAGPSLAVMHASRAGLPLSLPSICCHRRSTGARFTGSNMTRSWAAHWHLAFKVKWMEGEGVFLHLWCVMIWWNKEDLFIKSGREWWWDEQGGSRLKQRVAASATSRVSPSSFDDLAVRSWLSEVFQFISQLFPPIEPMLCTHNCLCFQGENNVSP